MMNFESVRSGLQEYNKQEVNIYCNYLKFLSEDTDNNNQKRNKWFPYFKDEEAIDLYKKVALDGLFIDGETITLQNKGRVLVSYNYQAYKNKLLNIYPETTFDLQLVCQGDSFSFHKESGKVIYSHKIGDPFADKREIKGTYCIIKNSRGEFLETLNLEDINKMKSAAKTKNVWNDWFSEMVLKSVIKRACKRHFNDITANIDKIDNELSDPGRITVENLLQEKIEACKTIPEINKLYRSEHKSVDDKAKFTELCGDRKKEIYELLPNLNAEDYEEALKRLRAGHKISDLKMSWKISVDEENELLTQV